MTKLAEARITSNDDNHGYLRMTGKEKISLELGGNRQIGFVNAEP